MAAGAIAATLLGMGGCTLVSNDNLAIAAAHVRIDDIAALTCLADRDRSRIGALSIAEMPEGRRKLSRAALRSLLSRRVPALASIPLGGAPDETITLERQRSATPSQACYRSTRPIAVDQAVTTDAVEVTNCASIAAAPVRFDRANSRLTAASDLAAGAYLGRIEPQTPAPDAGDLLSLDIVIGPVRIMRQVTALQSGVRSQRVFVRDDDGHVFRAPLAQAKP